MKTAKPFMISKHLVYEAYQRVRSNKGSAGVDGQTLESFEEKLKDNLFKLWNRLSSGSYFPPPVLAVPIPKKSGGERILGIPTIADRVAQLVVKLQLEPSIEPHFLPDSYGYRPGKSAIDAIDVTRQRCWRYDWVLEFDIKGLFDNIPHDLLLKAVRHHTDCKWTILYIERWLTAPLETKDGIVTERRVGTPQGGVISPLLANLFLHYVFDVWVSRKFPKIPWCRYADDGLAHCKTEREALTLKAALTARLVECGLEIHPLKTRVVYCKDGSRKGGYPDTKFDFLGYTFRRRPAKNSKTGSMFLNFSPAVSDAALKSMRQFIRRTEIRNKPVYDLEAIAAFFNPILRGWIGYYGRYYKSGLHSLYRYFNKTLIAWSMRKFKKLNGRRGKASRFIQEIAKRQPGLFVHWQQGRTYSVV